MHRFEMLKSEANGRVYQILRHTPFASKQQKKYGNHLILNVEQGRKQLVEYINRGTPFMAGRLGTTEGRALYMYHRKINLGGGYDKRKLKDLCILSGFFPYSEKLYEDWAELESAACKEADILGVMRFLGEEWIVNNLFQDPILLPAGGLASASQGWTWCLEDKTVLVVHPFKDTIERQYRENRKIIFPGSNALPVFSLKCIKAVQTIAGEKDPRFSTWFEALDWMTEQVAKTDFDIALVGCGAYGFPLSARIKQMGKMVVHMGGALQTLFGIRGSRWDNSSTASLSYNSSWVYPSESETPANYKLVENGCYWGAKEK